MTKVFATLVKSAGPLIYVISHQAKFDAALMLALLPADTLHILDPRAPTTGVANFLRPLASTTVFAPDKY